MNKTDFIKTLAERTGFDEAKCTKINSIIEDTFIVGKKHQQELIDKFQSELELSQEEAVSLYDTVMDIIGTGIKDKLKHPFGPQA